MLWLVIKGLVVRSECGGCGGGVSGFEVGE